MLFIEFDKKAKTSYKLQIYQQLRTKILAGCLKSGDRLPSTRELSKELNISRNTVLSAYDMLISEGYALSESGAGVFVNQDLQVLKSIEKLDNNQITSSLADLLSNDIISFDSGLPALDQFPRSKWNKFTSQAFNEAPISALGYDYPEGRPELREILADYLRKVRGIHCDAEQLIITSGSKQGLSLIAKCLLNQNSEVWIEDPSNSNVVQIFSYHTKHLVPIAVDEEGIQTSLFPAEKKPSLIFVTPSHQYPMGGILSIQRRLELARFAQSTGCYIVEDDYDSEFRYSAEPVNSLHELNKEQVIYVGTFSKILFPSLRLGYLVLPYPLIYKFREWKRLGDHHTNSINQLALMRFIECGDLERYVMKTKKLYFKRRNFLLSLLSEHFKGTVKVYGAPAGMHIVAEFNNIIFTPELIQRLKDDGVNLVPVENHAFIKGNHQSQVILGYAHLTPLLLEQGILKIKSIFKP